MSLQTRITALAQAVGADVQALLAAIGTKVAASGGTATNLTLAGSVTEGVFAVTGTAPALSPNNGTIQTWTLTANSTPTVGAWASGQAITLMVDDGTARTINWTALAPVWITGGGTPPILKATGYTPILLWKIGSVLYAARPGDA